MKTPTWAKLLVAVIVFFGLGAFAMVGLAATGGPNLVAPTSHTVVYKVGGTASQADITYRNSTGDTSQQDNIDVPLTRKSDGGQGLILENMHRGDFLYISAQNQDRYGSITCSIEVDGVVVKTNTSHGAFTIATCSGRL